MDQNQLPDGVPAKFFDHGAYGIREVRTDFSDEEIQNIKSYLVHGTLIFVVIAIVYSLFIAYLVSVGWIQPTGTGQMTVTELKAQWLSFPAVLYSFISLLVGVGIVAIGLFILFALLKRGYDWLRFFYLVRQH